MKNFIKYKILFFISLLFLSCTNGVQQRFDDNQSDDDSFDVDLDESDEDNFDNTDISDDSDISHDEKMDEIDDETTDEDVAKTFCSPNPCKNSGVCIDQKDAYKCNCKDTGFIGANCEDEPASAFITTWKTDNEGVSGNNQITISTQDAVYNYSVDCNNDGIIEAEHQTGNYTCEYDRQGTYTVSILGLFPGTFFKNPSPDTDIWGNPIPVIFHSDNHKLLSIEQWGKGEWTSMVRALSYCRYVVINAEDIPDISKISDMSGLFAGTEYFNQDINLWDVFSVKNMQSLFSSALSFNQDLSSWDVSNVENMDWMFYKATSFNQNIGLWDVSNVTNMHWMFSYATSFNQNLSLWDVSNVTNMGGMFFNATAFDQDISLWDVSNVVDMDSMFKNVTLSTENYDAILNGWSKLNLKTNVVFDAGESMYCKGAAARELLYSKYNWSVHDGGMNPDCEE